MSAPFIVGIDLGTSNSRAAVYDHGQASIVVNALGTRVTPSVVAFLPDEKTLVGEAARRQALLNPRQTILNAKRLIGRTFRSREVKAIREITAYEIVEAENGDAWVGIDGRSVSLPEVQAYLLQALRTSAEVYLESEVREVVITVPAFFDETQRQAARDAAEIAGLRAARIVSESTAAALAYGYASTQERRVAVVDLGGGTLDVTIMLTRGGQFTTLATASEMLLGGADFDRLIADHWVGEIQRASGLDPRENPAALQRLAQEAEAAKIALSSQPSASISFPYLLERDGQPIHFNRTFTRAELTKVVAPLLERIEQPCKQAVDQAELKVGDIDDVLLVGGMTRAVAVRERVAAFFGAEPLSRVSPDEAVVLGAATVGGVLRGDVPGMKFVDVAPKTIGIRAAGDRMVPLIMRSAPLPAAVGKTFAAKSRETGVEVEVLQGESEVASENRSLARVKIGGLPEDPTGKNKVRVAFVMNEDGCLEASAMAVASKTPVDAEVCPSSGLTRTQIEELAHELAARAAATTETGRETAAGFDAATSTSGLSVAAIDGGAADEPGEDADVDDGDRQLDTPAGARRKTATTVLVAAIVFLGVGVAAYFVYGS